MSLTASIWVLSAIVLIPLSFKRPVWALALYMQTYFAAPQNWWWGDDIPELRYALLAGLLLLAAVVANRAQSPDDQGHRRMGSHTAAILMCLNATFVHILLAVDRTISSDTYIELLKYSLLFYLIWYAIQDKRDFRTAIMAIAVGAFYIGYEVTINERGDFQGSRLEGVGAPGATAANSLANLLLICLPLISSLLVDGQKRHKLVAVLAAPLVLNVIILCNSRGTFLGLIGTGVTFLLLSRGKTRKRALQALALGGLALFLLLGDPKILERFSTTFVGSEERDTSAASRILFWEAGLRQLADYPLGAGGGSFKFNLGVKYQSIADADADVEARSLHQGYLTEATDWGVQGLILKLAFLGLAMLAAYRTEERCRLEGRTNEALTGLCVITSGVGLMIDCLFGSFLGGEWTYWVAALNVRYAELYRLTDKQAEEPVPVPVPALRGGPQAA
jgi:hypothetical protein